MSGNDFLLLYRNQNGALKSLSRYDVFNCWVQNEGVRRITKGVITK